MQADILVMINRKAFVLCLSIILIIAIFPAGYAADLTDNHTRINQNHPARIGDGLIIGNVSQNDMNRPGFPLDVTDWTYSIGAPMLSSPRIADVDGDGVLDIICTTYGLPPNPYWSGIVTILDIDGEPLPGWPVTTNSPFPASAAIGDIDNDGDMEIVIGDWGSMYVYNHDGTSYSGWPVGTGITESPTLADLDGDYDLEIIYPSNNILYVRHHDDSYYEGFPVSAPEDIGSAAIGDIDNDGELEIIAGTLAGPVGPDPYEVYVWNADGTVLDGFPVATSGTVKSTPALGDVDNDGMLEIVVAAYHTSNQDYLYCWDHEGNSKPGWPIRAGYCRLSSPALGDIDCDGDLEIFIGGLMTSPYWMEMLYGFDHDGQPLDGWPNELPHDGGMANINSSPTIVEADDELETREIFVKTVDHIFGLNSDGSFLEGFPYFLSDNSGSGTHGPSQAIGDLDSDGDLDFVFASISGDVMYVDGSSACYPDYNDWSMYKHDRWGTGLYDFEIPTDIKENHAIPIAFDLAQNYPNPFNAATNISFTISNLQRVNLLIYDLLGREICILLDEEKQAGTYSIAFDASSLSSGIYFYRLLTGDYSETKQMVLVK